MPVADYTRSAVKSYHKRNERCHITVGASEYALLAGRYGKDFNFSSCVKKLIMDDLQGKIHYPVDIQSGVPCVPVMEREKIHKMVVFPSGTKASISDYYGCSTFSLPGYVRALIRRDIRLM